MTVLHPAVWTDLLSDCDRRWISPFHYHRLFMEPTGLGAATEGETAPAQVREYALVSGTIHRDLRAELEGVRVASMRDVGLMKLDAVIGRGSRKDYYDLHAIASTHPLESLLDLAADKYPYARDFPLMAVESLLRFENADRDRQPEVLDGPSGPDVRSFFVAEARRLGTSWLGGPGRSSRSQRGSERDERRREL